MSDIYEIPLRVKNYKCFGNDPQGFEKIKPLNIIIGKNNSGKSSLLDLIEYASSQSFEINDELYRDGKEPAILLENTIEQKDANRAFSRVKNTKDITSPGRFVNKITGRKIVYEHNSQKGQTINKVIPSEDVPNTVEHELNKLSQEQPNPYKSKTFKKLTSERDITPEKNNTNLKLSEDGSGATNIIQNFLHTASLESDFINIDLLNDLNEIFQPDIHFTAILCQKLGNGNWEIFLEEETKGRIHLSNSGSGLKTVILCLIHILLIPQLENKKLSSYLFAFEELENNLHPSLQRNLLLYLRKKAKNEGCKFFLTTHSSVLIDLFSKDDLSQILHVTHDGSKSEIRTASSYYDNIQILDDLDIRASDLLQSNLVIWVEGPSDRVFLNRWIKLRSEGELIEGAQYQIVFYGGRLLSHFSFDSPEQSIDELIQLLTINRNAAVLIDSDKTSKQKPINDTKKRIVKELENNDGFTWVTKGKEIENYLPLEVINRTFGTKPRRSVGKYEDFITYLNDVENKLGKRYSRNKPRYAHQLADNFNMTDFQKNLDLDKKIDELITFINNANNR